MNIEHEIILCALTHMLGNGGQSRRHSTVQNGKKLPLMLLCPSFIKERKKMKTIKLLIYYSDTFD